MNSFQNKIEENESFLLEAGKEYNDLRNTLDHLKDLVENEKIVSLESLLPDIVIPSNMSGIDKGKYAYFVESEIIDKIKKVLRKILHFIFGGISDSIEALKDEADYLEQIRKKLTFYKKDIVTNEGKIDKVQFLKKTVAVWSYDETSKKTSAIRNIISQFELILQKNNAINKNDFDWKKVNDNLSDLGYLFDKEKATITLDESKAKVLEKDTVEDLKWNYNKIEDQLNELVHILGSRKVFDLLASKLNDIKNKSKKSESKVESIKDDDENSKNIQEEVTEIKEEFVIIESMKKIIFKYLHTLSHQLFILLKNLYKD